MKTLTFAFSAVGHTVERVRRVCDELKSQLEKLKLNEIVRFLVIVQRSNEASKVVLLNNVKWIYTNAVGLSKSRNIGIENSETDYIWFLDDDVSFQNINLMKVVSTIVDSNKDYYLGQIQCTDCAMAFRNYNYVFKNSPLSMLKRSSIEIIFSREFLLNHNLRFREDLGLGTPLISGEENCLLLSALKFSKNYSLLEFFIVRHPCSEQKRNDRYVSNFQGLMKSKGVVLSHLNLVYSVPLLIYWSIKFSVKHRRLTSTLWIFAGILYAFRD